MKLFIKNSMFPLTMILSMSSSALSYQFETLRCQTDNLEQGVQAAGRNAWVKKCFRRDYVRIFTDNNESKFGSYVSPRQLYVTFAVVDDDGHYSFPGNWIAPKEASADCGAPANYEVIGVCTSGCFMPDTKLSFDSLMTIKDAQNFSASSVTTLTSDSSIESLQFEKSPIASFTTDVRDSQQEILSFSYILPGKNVETKLEVTSGHPLLSFAGTIRKASDFKVGELLMAGDGQAVEIKAITGVSYFGKVINLWISRQTDLENVVVAEGVLAGTMYHQAGMGATQINRQIIRSKIPKSLLE